MHRTLFYGRTMSKLLNFDEYLLSTMDLTFLYHLETKMELYFLFFGIHGHDCVGEYYFQTTFFACVSFVCTTVSPKPWKSGLSSGPSAFSGGTSGLCAVISFNLG